MGGIGYSGGKKVGGDSGGRKVEGDRMEGRAVFWSSTMPAVDARIGPRRLILEDLKEGSFGRRRLPFFELFWLVSRLFEGEVGV